MTAAPKMLFAAPDAAEQQNIEWITGRYRTTAGVVLGAQDADRKPLNCQQLGPQEDINAGDTRSQWAPCVMGIDPATRVVYYIAPPTAGAERSPAPAEQPEEERGAGPEQAPKQQEPAAAEEGPARTTTPAAEQQAARPEKQAYDYTELLKCREIVEQACFGGFEITPSRKKDKTHKYGKKPSDIDPKSRKEGEKDGVYRFVHKAEKALEIINGIEKTAGVQYALGIRFGAEIDYYGKYTPPKRAHSQKINRKDTGQNRKWD